MQEQQQPDIVQSIENAVEQQAAVSVEPAVGEQLPADGPQHYRQEPEEEQEKKGLPKWAKITIAIVALVVGVFLLLWAVSFIAKFDGIPDLLDHLFSYIRFIIVDRF